MAIKWENDELKCENRRFKMYNEELTVHQKKKSFRKTKKAKETKYREICADFAKTISKLEQENKYLRTLASVQVQNPRTEESHPAAIIHQHSTFFEKEMDTSWKKLPKIQNLLDFKLNTIANLIN